MSILIRNREPARHAILAANDPRRMAFAGRVFNQLDVTGLDLDLLSSRDLKLSAPAQRDHVLTAGADVPVVARATGG